MQSKSLREIIATRDRSADWYAVMNWLPNPDTVLTRTGGGIEKFRDLLTDPHVAACVTSRKAGTLSMEWMIDAGDADARFVDLVTGIFTDIDMDRVLGEALDAVLYGYQPFEIMWEPRGGQWIVADLVGKPPEWFQYSPNNELLFITRANIHGDPVPPDKFLVARNQPSYQNPYGVAALSRGYWWTTFKRAATRFWTRFAQKYGMPHVFATLPAGAKDEDLADAVDQLEKLVEDGISAMREGTVVTVLEPKNAQSNGALYKELINLCNGEIAKALIGQTLTTEVGDTGTYAAAKVHAEVRGDIVDADRRMVERTMNALITLIGKHNVGADAPRPTFRIYEEERVDLERAEYDAKLCATGRINLTKEYYLRHHHLAEDEFEIVDEPPPTPPAAFAEGDGGNAGQGAVDALAESLAARYAETQAESIIEPVMAFVRQGDSFEEISGKLAAIYPSIPTDETAAIINRAMALAAECGRVESRGEK